MPIAQHLEPVGMIPELLIKIEHVTMRIAFAQYRNESEDVSFKTETLAVGLDHPFTRDL